MAAALESSFEHAAFGVGGCELDRASEMLFGLFKVTRAFTVTEETPFRTAAGKSFRTPGGHTAHAHNFGIMDGQVIIKGTVAGAGMFCWDIQGKDLGGDPDYDLDINQCIQKS